MLIRLKNCLDSPGKSLITRWMAAGKNIRDFRALPFPLTRKMAHAFTQAPEFLDISGAFFYAQIVGFGGSEILVLSSEQYFFENLDRL